MDVANAGNKPAAANTVFNTTLENKQLVPLEIEAIKAAISDELFNKQGWEVMPTGQVKDADGNEIYKRGYVNGLRKMLPLCCNDS